MKKFIVLAIGFLALFGFAASAFAIHAEIPAESQAVVAKGSVQLTISGDLRVRGWLEKNISGFSGFFPGGMLDGQNQTYYDERVRLAVDATQGNVSGRIHLESGDANSDVFKWGSNVPGGLQGLNFGDTNTKPTDMSILEAWIQYTGAGLGMPAGIKVGHMPLALGPDTLFFDHTKFGDDAIVGWVDPTPTTHIVALTIKAVETDSGNAVLSSNANDLDIYVGLINQVLAGQNLQAYYAYANMPTATLSLQDLGINASGSFGGLTYSAEYDQNLGKLGGLATTVAPFDTVNGGKAEGYALQLNLGYKLGSAGIRAMAAYGSGPKANETDAKEFINFLSANQYNTLVYGYRVVNAMGELNGAGTNNQISNTEMLNLGVDVNPTADLKASVDGYLLRATNTDAFFNFANPGAGVSHNIGTEIDAKVTYALAKNLNYFFNAGYLIAGDFYKDAGYSANSSDTNVGKVNPFVLMHGLELSF